MDFYSLHVYVDNRLTATVKNRTGIFLFFLFLLNPIKPIDPILDQ